MKKLCAVLILVSALFSLAVQAEIVTESWVDAPFVGGTIRYKANKDYPGAPFVTRYRPWHFAPGAEVVRVAEIQEVKLVCIERDEESCMAAQFVGIDLKGQRVLLSKATIAFGNVDELKIIKKEMKGDLWWEPFMLTQSMAASCVGAVLIPVAFVFDLTLFPVGGASFFVHQFVKLNNRKKIEALFTEGKEVKMNFNFLREFMMHFEHLNEGE